MLISGQLLEFNQKRKNISTGKRENHISIHNMNYWQFGDYIGIGAGSHGKITNISSGRIERYVRHKIPERYIELVGCKNAITEKKVLEINEIPLEFMMNALRLTKGIPTNLFLERTGLPIELIKEELLLAEDGDLLNHYKNKIKPSFRGQRYLNDLLQIFMK